MVIEIKDQDFVKSGLPVIVDFWAPWCAPCGKITAKMDKLSQ